jgi:hypothetical protein
LFAPIRATVDLHASITAESDTSSAIEPPMVSTAVSNETTR